MLPSQVTVKSIAERWVLALCAAVLLGLVGCASKVEPLKEMASIDPATAVIDPFKVAFVYVDAGEGAWTSAHENGRKALQQAYGDKVAITVAKRVPESSDAEPFIRNLVRQGNQVIFGTTFGYMEPMLKVSGDNKDVKFEHATGYKTAVNMRVYDSRIYEASYMAGVVAGRMSKSGVLGVVGSIPIPDTIRNINSFTLGAQSTNPAVVVRVSWVNVWFDPAMEAAAASALIRGGADVLFQTTDSFAVAQTAEKMGKRSVGWLVDMKAYGPNAHLASAVVNWGPYYVKAVGQAMDGSWKGKGGWWNGTKEGAVDLVSIAADVPEDTKKRLDEIKAGLKDGSFSIWKGPITDNTGRELLARGVVANDPFIGRLLVYVKGVEGKVPGQ
jgi:basic membrane protein A and related proteins